MAFPPKLITNYQSAATHQQQADEIIAGHARSAGAGEGVGGILLGVQDDDVCAVRLCICLDGVALRAVSILEQIAWRIARDRFFHRPIVVGVAVAVGNRKILHAALPVVSCVDFEQQTACPSRYRKLRLRQWCFRDPVSERQRFRWRQRATVPIR